MAVLTLLAATAVWAQSNPIPIVSMSSIGVIGGARDGKWLTSTITGPTIKAGDKFDWYRLGSAVKKGIVIESAAANEPCEQFFSTIFTENSMGQSREQRLEGLAIGSGVTWNPMPRAATPFAASVAKRLYRASIATLLKSKGLTRPVVGPVRAWKADLDGDGVDEVILESSTWNGENMTPSAKAGDYAIVAIRQVVGGKPKTTLLAAEVIRKNVEFSAPTRFRLAAILDLNGDGTMEFVVDDEYYEGAGAQAWEIRSGKAVAIEEVADGCGV
jgi:hypothetical protein